MEHGIGDELAGDQEGIGRQWLERVERR